MSEVFEALPSGLPSLRSPGLEQGFKNRWPATRCQTRVNSPGFFCPVVFAQIFEGAVITRCCIFSNPLADALHLPIDLSAARAGRMFACRFSIRRR